jgi:single-strand DNA-binding protein
MKSIVIAGGIGRDAETKQAGNSKVTRFSVAVDDGWGDKRRTIWFDCDLWGDRGEKLAGMLTKGTKVAVSGDLSTREHNGKTYLTVRADNVTLMSGKPQGEKQEQRQEQRQQSRAELDDEIPF